VRVELRLGVLSAVALAFLGVLAALLRLERLGRPLVQFDAVEQAHGDAVPALGHLLHRRLEALAEVEEDIG
jgi:hypothetical protein